jgi:hypothetical protein
MLINLYQTPMKFLTHFNCFSLFLLFSQLAFASPFEQQELEIEKHYQQAPQQGNIVDRIKFFSKQFMGKPYVLGPLGEGAAGFYDQSPLFRFDGFDCTTYVETVLGFAYTNNASEFKQTLNKIRYKQGKISYLNRNHFMSIDWNPNNTHNGLLQEYTDKIVDKNATPIFIVADATIDKAGWLQKKSISDIKISASELTKAKRLQKLKAQSTRYIPVQSHLKYLPLSKLFNSDRQPMDEYFQQIPDGSIIEIIRPNWQLKKVIGTNLQISHLGFAIKQEQVLYFREASSEEKKVIDIPLTTYLKKYIDSPTVKGINIFIPSKQP